MAAAHCVGLCLVSSAGTRLSPELFHISIMSSSSVFPNELRSHRVVLNRCGLRNLFGTGVAEAGRKNYGAGCGKLRNRGSSLPCSCLLDRNFLAKSNIHVGIRTEVIPFSSVSGGFLGLKSIGGDVSVCTFYKNKDVGRFGSHRMRLRARLGGDGDVDINGDAVAEDYYSVLGLTPDATPEEIKRAYYACMKACHPDLSGNDPSVNSFCSFVNEIYEVLMDPEQRLIYDEINGYTLTAINPFNDTSAERDHAFVDEFTCIGCKNCAHTAPETFDIEEEYGRARVISQTGNPVLIERAIQTCPVDCIYWTSAQQLTLLEDEMRRVERVNVGLMLSGMGFQSPDVFTQASWRWEKRQAKAVERARVRMMKEGGKSGKEAWWNVNWGSAADEKSSKAAADKYARERAAKTAAAARRWREYSRRGVDRRAIRILAAESAAKAKEDVDKEKAGVS